VTGLAPTFALTAGGLRSRTDEPVGGPTRMVVDRGMDVACDGVRVDLAQRGDVAAGDPLELALGHDGEESPVFVGEVAAVRPSLAGTQLRGVGVMTALLHLRTATTYAGRAAGDVVSDLLARAGLRPGVVENGPTLPRYVVHPGRSAHAHLRELADRLGLELYSDRRGRVMFHAPPAPAPAEQYTFGRHLLEAAGQLRAGLPGAIYVGGESPASERGADTSHWLTRDEPGHPGVGESGDPRRVILDPVARTKDLVDRFAEGWWTVATRGRRRLRLTVLGRPELELGDPVSATGSPDGALDGSGYVRALRHAFSAHGGFITELTVTTGGAR
jgi:hypothetical protein